MLSYKIGDVVIFLTPDGGHSSLLKEALKFESERSAITFQCTNKSFLEFTPSLEEISDTKSNCLLDD